jgi:hypothetical protein
MLGNPVCILVPRLWSVGFTDTQITLFMIMECIPGHYEESGLRSEISIHGSVRYYILAYIHRYIVFVFCYLNISDAFVLPKKQGTFC